MTALSLCLLAAAAFAAETLHEIPWPGDPEAIPGARVLPPDAAAAFARLEVRNAEARPATVTVLTIKRPPVTRAQYALTGTVRHEGVEGPGFLEMWSVFPDGGRYFSRTLATAGPMKHLEGAAEWRPFVLPFTNREGAPPPTTLIVNVVLPGRGTVHLGPLRLVQYAPGEDLLALSGQWWGDQTAGLVGGVAGSALGILGAVIGWLASMGRARGLVLGLTRVLLGIGVAALAVGVWAVVRGQPYAVYYPLLLMGGISALLGGAFRPILRRRYEALELRRIRAADAR